MAFYLGIDLGTSYFKAALFDEQGRLCGLGRQFVNKVVMDNRCELPVESFWKTLEACVAQAIAAAGVTKHDIKAMSYSSQANSFILLDKNDHPLSPLILWPDTRAGAPAPALLEFCGREGWRERTGMGIGLSAHSMVTKVMGCTSRICTISDYLTLCLTGSFASDGSTASLLGLIDTQKCVWWDEALEVAGLSKDQLPPLYRMGTSIGRIRSSLLGLSSNTHYTLGGLDHHMAALGAGLYGTDNVSESTGTVLAAVQSVTDYQTRNEVCVAPGLHDKHYFRMTFNDNGARLLELYQQTKAPEYTIEQLIERAKNGEDDIVKGILESTAKSLKELVRQLGAEGDIVSTGGGARSRYWIELKAAMLNRTFVVPQGNEVACLGAAMMGAYGVGALKNLQEWFHVKETISYEQA